MEEMTIYRGEAFPLEIGVTIQGEGESILQKIEMMLGKEQHLWPGDMTYADGVLTLQLTQTKTFSWPAGVDIPIQLRGKDAAGEVHRLDENLIIHVGDSESEEVL